MAGQVAVGEVSRLAPTFAGGADINIHVTLPDEPPYFLGVSKWTRAMSDSEKSVSVSIVTYDTHRGVVAKLEEDALLSVTVDGNARSVTIAANRSGLRSLARHCLTLADEATPNGRHLDIDDYTGWFVEGSLGIRFEVDDSMVYTDSMAD